MLDEEYSFFLYVYQGVRNNLDIITAKKASGSGADAGSRKVLCILEDHSSEYHKWNHGIRHAGHVHRVWRFRNYQYTNSQETIPRPDRCTCIRPMIPGQKASAVIVILFIITLAISLVGFGLQKSR